MSGPHRAAPKLAAVATCLFLSGTGSLVLEVSWSRLLKLVFGSTTLSISTILVAYMLGLGLGGLVGGRLARRVADGVRAYGVLEIGVGVYALAVPFVLGAYPWLNRTLLGGLGFWPAAAVRFVLSLVVLLAPTLVMGATLPLLVAALRPEEGRIAAPVGLLYGVNTLGAVTGTVAASFVLFPVLGLAWSNAAGAALDALAGALALTVVARGSAAGAAPVGKGRVTPAARDGRVTPAAQSGRVTPAARAKPAPTPAPTPAPASAPTPGPTSGPASGPADVQGGRWNAVVVSYALVGATALVYEVAWTRALTMIFGSSVYAFATMLAAFLVGIALGSLVARPVLDGLARPRAAYAGGVAALGLLAFVTLLLLARASGLALGVLEHAGASSRNLLLAGFGLSALAMLGPTLVLGALFPLVARAAAAGRDASAAVGDVYFVNTLGSAAGAFLAGFVLIPGLGLARTIALAIAVNLATAGLLLLWQREWTSGGRRVAAAAALVAAGGVLLLPPAWDVRGLLRAIYYRPSLALEFGIDMLPFEGFSLQELRYYKDGVSASIAITDEPGGTFLRINGKPDASLLDMPTQALSGHLPFLFGPHADDVMVIGYASGVTTGAVSLHAPRRLDVIEIEPAIVEASRWFERWNHKPLERPFTHLVLDDARAYLTRTSQQYDVLISEPSNPFLAGCSNLFTEEFFHLARRALRPGGRLLQWVQLYGMDPDSIRSVLAAVRTEFPYVTAFHFHTGNPDLLLMASDRPLTAADLPRWEGLAPEVQADLEQLGIYSTRDLWTLVRLTSDDVRTLAGESRRRNTDDSMFVELHTPWLVHESSAQNFDMLARVSSGVLPVAESGGARLSADEVGRLALAYAVARDNLDVAGSYAAAAEARGPSAAALTARAEILRRAHDTLPAAAAKLEDAVALDPALPEARDLRARLFEMRRRPEQALAEAELGTTAAPRDARLVHRRLRLQSITGANDAAWATAQALMALPGARFEFPMWADSGIAAVRAGRLDQGIRWLEQYLAVEPYSATKWEALADAYTRAGRTSDAARALRNRQAAIANNVRTRHRDARFEARFGSKERAAELLRSILEVDPSYAAAKQDLDALSRP